MSQTGTAKLNQLMTALGVKKVSRPTSEKAAQVAAQVIKGQWMNNPQRLASVHIEASSNEVRCLSAKKGKDAQAYSIAAALIEELCREVPQELMEDPLFRTITKELAVAIGKNVEEIRQSSSNT